VKGKEFLEGEGDLDHHRPIKRKKVPVEKPETNNKPKTIKRTKYKDRDRW
jgi:hypothetical protein